MSPPTAALSLNLHHHNTSIPPSSSSSYLSVLCLSFHNRTVSFRQHRGVFCLAALKTDGSRIRSGGEREEYGLGMPRKPVVSPGLGEGRDGDGEGEEEEEKEEEDEGKRRWVDWEDQILEEAVPLVSLVRMILHSGQYENGDRLSPQHQKTLMEKLLPYHPESEKKIGSGVDYITIGFHPQFEQSRCLFIVRKDGELVDFSYWKCIKGLIREKYPLFADSFLLRHFDRRRHYSSETGT